MCSKYIFKPKFQEVSKQNKSIEPSVKTLEVTKL